jgi:hypothetical protein
MESSVIRCRLVFPGLFLLAWGGSAQLPLPKAYNTQEDYCRENPKMPTCINGKPMKMIDLSSVYKMPAPSGAQSAAPTRSRRTQEQPAAPMGLADWRFSHSSPAMLISLNLGSLLQSPVWAPLFSSLGATGTDSEKVRAALSDIGQILLSIQNGTATPSVLMLAKGNVDSAMGALLRSGSGMQSKRLDAITLLIGDAQSLEFASLRLRGPAGRETWNPLKQTATLEAMKYDAWVGVDPRHLAALAAAFGGGANPSLAMLGNLRGFSMGIYLRDQIRIEAALEAPSADVAARLLAAYQQSAAKQPVKDKEQVWVTTEGAKLRYIQIVELSQLKSVPGLDGAVSQVLGSQITPVIHALAGMGSRSSATATAPKAAQGGIVIQGLDTRK